jgi:hypothetical protein
VSLFLRAEAGSCRYVPSQVRAGEGAAGTLTRWASEVSVMTSTDQGATVIERAWVVVCGTDVVESVTRTVNA